MRPGPSPGSRIFQISVPVPDPANFEFESQFQSRILKWVPVPVPDFRDRDCGIPGTLSRMPTPDTHYHAPSLQHVISTRHFHSFSAFQNPSLQHVTYRHIMICDEVADLCWTDGFFGLNNDSQSGIGTCGYPVTSKIFIIIPGYINKSGPCVVVTCRSLGDVCVEVRGTLWLHK